MLAIFIGYLPLWINIFGGRDVYCNSPVEQVLFLSLSFDFFYSNESIQFN